MTAKVAIVNLEENIDALSMNDLSMIIYAWIIYTFKIVYHRFHI